MIPRRPVTAALAALLTSATALPVGRGRMPDAKPPYYLLYSLDTGLDGPPLADTHDDISLVYQVTSVSGPAPTRPGSAGTLDQAELLADKARTTFLGRDPATGLWLHPLVIPGAKVMSRTLEVEPGATTDPTDGIISYVQRFRFDLTPA
ncbi:hypothetical protein [Streptomyces sp. ML-6]|uniref:hypothetical protein n=1 Tax=Streptomyces sp. ML-6 TaxID=2982693 RepID=UPI0024BFCADB|nr:hypothetical protein [Streptomyces sp. ML-6]MDK0525006.1 hypothetical protein [Streptomyces sp. ML-6]